MFDLRKCINRPVRNGLSYAFDRDWYTLNAAATCYAPYIQHFTGIRVKHKWEVIQRSSRGSVDRAAVRTAVPRYRRL